MPPPGAGSGEFVIPLSRMHRLNARNDPAGCPVDCLLDEPLQATTSNAATIPNIAETRITRVLRRPDNTGVTA